MTSIDINQTLRPRSSSKSPKAGRKETRGGGIEVERFYTKPGVDFGLADSRHPALATLGRDMSLWHDGADAPVITPQGRALVKEAFG